jgi:hypothetical protein
MLRENPTIFRGWPDNHRGCQVDPRFGLENLQRWTVRLVSEWPRVCVTVAWGWVGM